MKKFFRDVAVFVTVVLILYGFSLLASPSEEEQLERKIEQEMYEHEIWQEGFDRGYGQAKWELEGAIDRAYYEGYQDCLADYGIEE